MRLLVIAFLSWPTICAAQVSGRFFLEKETYARGEPVFLLFEASNKGSEAISIGSAVQESFCSGYEIRVKSKTRVNPDCAPLFLSGSCLSSSLILKPGEKRVERVLLNDQHEIRTPGTYVVEAKRLIAYAPASVEYFTAAKSEAEVRDRLTFRVDWYSKIEDSSLQAWADQLNSEDLDQRREAAMVLSVMAPPSLETLLLGFCDSAEFRSWAPRAMRGLNTPRSLQALADLLQKTEPGTPEHIDSATFLGESGDSKWFPILREIAENRPNVANYVDAAAASGGEESLPLLLSLMQSPDRTFTHVNAVSAFGYTAARAAIPILLDLLRSGESDIEQRVYLALRQLTHLTGDTPLGEHPHGLYSRWAAWWYFEGQTAPIYRANPCGEIKMLP